MTNIDKIESLFKRSHNKVKDDSVITLTNKSLISGKDKLCTNSNIIFKYVTEISLVLSNNYDKFSSNRVLSKIQFERALQCTRYLVQNNITSAWTIFCNIVTECEDSIISVNEYFVYMLLLEHFSVAYYELGGVL